MAAAGGQYPSAKAITYLVNHIVLPPQLPQADDFNAENERCLLETSLNALKALRSFATAQHDIALTHAILTIENLQRGQDSFGNVSETELCKLLGELSRGENKGSIPLEIKAQNAGVLISSDGSEVTFEFFELSPDNKSAMLKGRLVRTFPAFAASISTTKLQDTNLQKTLADTLAKMSTQTAPGFQPIVRKAGQDHDEERDTTHPGMVTDYFLNIIAALGKTTLVTRITKNTREEVLWDNCKQPWRRSPLWLLLRVTLQLLFNRQSPKQSIADGLYKVFVVQLLSSTLGYAQNYWHSSGSEPIHAINAKILRRVRKLEASSQLDCVTPSWIDSIQACMEEAFAYMNTKWNNEIQDPAANLKTINLRWLQPKNALDMALPELDTFLDEIKAREAVPTGCDFNPGPELPAFASTEVPWNFTASDDYKPYRLAAMESWVEHHLQSWLESHRNNPNTCQQLYQLMTAYYSCASRAYEGVPTSTSVMYLTILEIWVACDKSACGLFPLISIYDPEVRVIEMQCLTLPLRAQMQRLHAVETYVQSRERSATDRTSPYRDFGNGSSFAVRYFRKSSQLQGVLQEIKEAASKKREAKCKELAALKSQYKNLMDQHNKAQCEFVQIVTDHYHGYTETVHSRYCTRCSLKEKADGLTINIFEWPLSSKPTIAQATVFELKIPATYSAWRDASLFVISNVLGFKHTFTNTPQNSYTLGNHADLSHMLDSDYHSRRIFPLSTVKPHLVTHRKQKKAIQNLQVEEVCLENGLQYNYYDATTGAWTAPREPNGELPLKCTLTMPVRSKALERFLSKPPSAPDGVQPNEVIASLSECPPHLSLEEYKAFGTLPYGRNIFYSTVLTQLAAPTLNFSSVETQCLLSQTMTQVGLPDGTVQRISHLILSDPDFGSAMMTQLEIAASRVEKNWESWRAMSTFVQLACRITNLTTSSDVRQRSLRFIHKVRSISIAWFHRLKDRATSSTNDEQRVELLARATEIALFGTTTFDVEDEFVDDTLDQHDAVSSLLQFSIAVQENEDLISSGECLQKSAVQAWRALMYRILPKLRNAILRDSAAINQAVLRCWANFQPHSNALWSMVDGSHQHWLTILSGELPVHVNLLTGQLLVNGLPLTRLPSEYLSHPVYQPLFSGSALEVVPTDEPGMRFSAKTTYHEHKLHFGMAASDMLVVAICGSNKFELIPERVFTSQMPQAFVTSYIHWYEYDTGNVAFRPRHQPWNTANSGQWYLERHGSSWRLHRGSETLMNMKSGDTRTVSSLFRSVENAQYIHVSHDTILQSITIELPRLKLDFRISDGEDQICSRQYRGMILDEDQRIGTLIGLTSKLVLRHTSTPNDRIVLIPEGALSYRKTLSHHLSVSISRQNGTAIHAYQLDTTLGRVLDSGAMQSKLLLCLLHALTSHSLCDPLTQYTGTESALTILRSSAVRSFRSLQPQNVALLNQIANLSPKRGFYPQCERVMQQIGWDPNLSSGSQHGEFQVLVREIFDHEKRMSLFHSEDVFQGLERKDLAWMSAIDPDLHARANNRSSTFLVANFGADCFTFQFDAHYAARDRQSDSDRGQKAFLTASMLLREQPLLDQPVTQFRVYQDHFHGNDARGLTNRDLPTLQYDSKWLGSPSPLVQDLWTEIHQYLATHPVSGNKFDILVWLATMAYASKADMNIVRAFVMMYRLSQPAYNQIPSKPLYYLFQGSSFKVSEIQSAANYGSRSYNKSSESRLPKEGSETDKQHLRRIKNLFNDRKKTAVQTFVTALQVQWPCEYPNTPSSAHVEKYLDTASAMSRVNDLFQKWYDNRTFEQYMQNVSKFMNKLPAKPIAKPRFDVSPPYKKPRLAPSARYCSVSMIFDSMPWSHSGNAMDILAAPQRPELTHVPTSIALTEVDEGQERLDQFCKKLSVFAKTAQEERYVNNLRVSCDALRRNKDSTDTQTVLEDVHAHDKLQKYFADCEKYFTAFNRRLEHILTTTSIRSNAIAASIKPSPRLSPSFWLVQLNRDHYKSLSAQWSEVMIEYGLSVTELHRAQRLVALLDKPAELNEELKHTGHSNWVPREHPETLLLEAESGILLRPVQATISAEMIQPPGAQNTVMQLNMGEGKSSTIVPNVAANVADGKKLARVIVAKAQSRQMLEMLIAKLGGLLNRRIYHMPFSRDLRLDEKDVQTMRELYQDCLANRGILLVQPEHILSFKLMGIECLLTEKPEAARLMLDMEQWFGRVSRDIVDESDENFSVKFELIYTMGSQQSIGFAPDRWLLIQEVMGLILRFAVQVLSTLPHSIEIQHDVDGRFPRVRILNDEGADALLALLTEHIIKNGLTGLPICNQSKGTQEAILCYISIADLSAKQIQAVEQSRFWTMATTEPLLLVRGLIAGGVLRFCLSQKRWRVNYGLDSTRVPSTLLAVPYKAKDSPSPRSEFSHPDVVILLTQLSFYYGGLRDEELFDAFNHLLKSDHSSIHYDEWVRTAGRELPATFRQLSGVSIKDRFLCIQQVFPHLRYSRAAINYYLSFLVFPKAMKEFPSKVSASGWDLGAVKTNPTTGFSGTNDTLHVLPLSVKHLDLPSQSHTNALVLGYILQQETSVEKLPPRSEGSDAEHLLTAINNLNPEVRVVLDVGAQILEMDNAQVAECWLSVRKDDKTEAVVFFNDELLSVLDVDGRIEPFQTSPFAKQLDRCLVYLDEAHTRGTDLKLPRNYRAAVTLGANLTKDRLVQACMRLRKLGKGQSVVFIASQEICSKICERTDQKPDEPISVMNVLCWSISETWIDLSRSMPLWAVQGHRYETRKHLLNGSATTLSQAEEFLEDEAQTIQDRYSPSIKNTGHSLLQDLDNPSIRQIHTRCLEFQAMAFNSATLQEEQERELSPEIEEERQIERPPKMVAETHKISPSLDGLVRIGKLIRGSPGFVPAFQALSSTTAGAQYNLNQLPTELLVTQDFMRTVKIPAGCKKAEFVSDNYQRSVQWVLSVVDQACPDVVEHLIAISPFEANELYSTIIAHKKVTLHLFAPRFNASFAPLDELELFTIGRAFDKRSLSQSLTTQLNLFAGSLYLRSFAEYQALCDFLGLLRGTAGPDQHVFADGFIDPPSGVWDLKTSPVQFLRALLMKIRKEGEGVEKTHMGRLLGGVRLEECDFEPENSQP
ncbi:hypothetical protein OPT61_g2025 [Boeremia exigua]|uniref:Uncharacterized protein n=1 Tax=Boeremia exigua TaxID=749465 RepID=A0ACC2IN81_9PLEO|nr:hypothetical protein OPT61_g2025 [Boeremia exigua]